MKKNLIISTLLLPLFACSGGGGSDSTTPPPTSTPATKTGIFVDSPVINIPYRTETQNGVTGALGEFDYLQGESVTFSIGNIDFPTVVADSIITPLSMDSSSPASIGDSRIATNIAVLLQSLDSNANPLDGITIDGNITPSATTQVIFDQPTSDFQSDGNVGALMIATSSTLVPESAAQAHVSETLGGLLSGAWLLGSASSAEYSALVFIDDARYIIANTSNSEFDTDIGKVVPVSAEFGTYAWNLITGSFLPSRIGQSDGPGGLVDDGSGTSTYTLAFSDGGSTFTLSSAVDGDVAATKISSTNNLTGAWLLETSSINYSTLVFIDDTRYIIAHTNNTEFDATLGATIPVSAEFGSYVWDSATGSFVATKSGESDGTGGLVESALATGSYTLALSNSGNTLTLSSELDGAVEFTRIKQDLDEVFSLDMTQKTASSVITFSSCPNEPLGWNYTFTSTSMTLAGSDTWTAPACTTGPDESISVNNMQTLASDYDIPFNCTSYPICKSTDFNKILSGVDDDDRDFTSTYTFNRQTNVLTYVKSVEGVTFTEVVTIQ